LKSSPKRIKVIDNRAKRARKKQQLIKKKRRIDTESRMEMEIISKQKRSFLPMNSYSVYMLRVR
jgi:hypothetical protein